MNKKTLLLISTLLAPAMSHGGWFDAVTLSTGGSEDFDTPVRIGLRGDIDTRWFESGTGYLSAYSELALNHFSDSDRAATAISWLPRSRSFLSLSMTSRSPSQGLSRR